MAKFKPGDRITDREGTEYLVYKGRGGRTFIYVEAVDITFGTNPNEHPDDYTLVEQPAARVVNAELPPREGDTVLIRMTYDRLRDDGTYAVSTPSVHGVACVAVRPEALAGVEKRRDLKVGDRVKHKNGKGRLLGTIAALATREAWILLDEDGDHSTYTLADLEPA